MSADANTPVPEKQHWKQHWAEAVAECITDEQEALRIVGFYEDGEWQPAMLSIGRENLAIKRELAALAADVEKLSAFKAFVHEFLDRNGVPTDPPGTMREEGCRVGQRLKYLVDERDAARARPPDGYALVMDTGNFVGAWKSREIAENLQNRSSMSKGEVVRAFVFVDEPAAQEDGNG